jgi:hypothetical protein
MQLTTVKVAPEDFEQVAESVERFNADRCRWRDADLVSSGSTVMLSIASADVGRFFDLFAGGLSEVSRRRMFSDAARQVERLVGRLPRSVSPTHMVIRDLGLV